MQASLTLLASNRLLGTSKDVQLLGLLDCLAQAVFDQPANLRRRIYWAVQPPSAVKVTPVIWPAEGVHKKEAMAAMSSSLTNWREGCFSARRSSVACSNVRPSHVNGQKVGTSLFGSGADLSLDERRQDPARIDCVTGDALSSWRLGSMRPVSRAVTFVRPTTACLEAT